MQIALERKTKTVTRLQYPITASYCFTNCRSQGQTIPRIIVDIAPPPLGNSHCSIYMLLYQGALNGRQPGYYKSLMMKSFWEHMNRSWSLRMTSMKGRIVWTRQQRSGGKKQVPIQIHDLYGCIQFTNDCSSIAQARFMLTTVGTSLVKHSGRKFKHLT